MVLKKLKQNKVFFIILLFIVIQIIIIFLDNFLLWDENVYLSNARKILGYGKYSEEYKFPLLSLLILPFCENIILAKIFLVILYSISIYFFYRILRELNVKEWLALVFTLFYSFHGLILFWANRIYPECPATAFLVISIYFMLKNRIILFSLFSVLSFLTKFTYALFPLSYLIYKAVNKEFRDIFRYVIFFLIFLSPWLIYNFVIHGNPLWNILEQYRVFQEWTKPEPLTKYIEILWLNIGFFLISLLYFRDKKAQVFYIHLILSIIAFAFVNLKLERYLIEFLPTALILSALLANSTKLYSILLILYSITIGLTISKAISGIGERIYCNEASFLKFVLLKLKELNATRIVSNCCWVWAAYYLNIEAYSLFDKNVTKVIEEVKPEYIIYSPNFGIIENYTGFENLKLLYDYEDDCGIKVFIYEVK